MNAAVDPWAITPREFMKYQEQFRSLKPMNEMVTGGQAREFFLQSQLPPLVLGEIWALADTDSDGKMDIHEFSIACKLINLKLRSFEIPKKLPPVLVASLAAISGSVPPNVQAAAGIAMPQISPLANRQPVSPAAHIPPGRPPMPSHPSMVQQPPQPSPLANVMPLGAPISAPILPGLIGAPMANRIVQQPLMSAGPPPIIPMQPPLSQYSTLIDTQPAVLPHTLDLLGNKITSPVDLIGGVGAIGGSVIGASVVPAPPTPQSGPPSRSMSISGIDKAPSLESPGHGGVEWAVKSQSKLKYTQMFNSTDRTRSGFLTGAQARNLMVQTKLPQAILAQIWALSDMDSDGRLGCEEFVLAMYLCEMASLGEAIPTVLPLDLIPPSFRKTVGSRHGSSAGLPASASRHGSVSSQSGGVGTGESDPSAGLPNQSSFEDKRKENYDKGQAELERRRKVLLDIQRKEQEERERKEREEAEKREKARIEAERRQHEELERQLQLQREMEQEKEERRLREIEQKETARKEMEKQRQLEWEKQRIAEMQLQRQREQEKVLKLKAQNQSYTIELGGLNEKIKELSQKICDTRAGVTNVKTIIDGMRSTRDTQMTDMSQLKARIVEQNARLIHLSQEKAKLDMRNKMNQDANPEGGNDQHFSNKQILINQLRNKIDTAKKELVDKREDCSTNGQQLMEVKLSLATLIEDCEILYHEYDAERAQINELKINKKNESISYAWDSNASWKSSEPTATTTTVVEQRVAEPVAEANYEGYVRYRAIYEFEGRNSDEITFQVGDIVMVPLVQNAEPGWLAGEINGHTGWFPETYVELADDENTRLEGITEVAETISPVTHNAVSSPTAATNTATQINSPTTAATTEQFNGADSELYTACYPYESAEPDDLVFTAGEHIRVIKKEGDWWTGVIGSRTGIFPSNYVQPDDGTAVAMASDINAENGNQVNDNAAVQSSNTVNHQYADILAEAKTLEDADSEVSEINTQPKNDQVQDNYSRPMSTTSTTPGLRKAKGEVAQVIANYEATSTEQLSLQRGQLIMIRKKTDSGWWEGELQARGRRRQIGWFPATYVKVLQSGRLSGRSTPVSGGKIQMNEAILDKVVALYPYKAQNDDELSFEKDDIISVMGRDEPEWWRGECQGLIGLFPSNYVGPFVTSGNM